MSARTSLARVSSAAKGNGGLVVALLVLVAGALAWWKRASFGMSSTSSTPPPPSSGSSSASPSSSSAPASSPPSTSLAGRMLANVRKLLPGPADTLGMPSPTWDAILGGRRGEVFGGPAWGYYQTWVGPSEAQRVSGGTTCGIVLAYLLAKSGAPVDMVNRLPTDPVAPGSGFVPGAHISKALAGAKKAGLYIDKPRRLVPGWAYWIDHEGRPGSDHVGTVYAVGPVKPDGTREVLTADGGQTCPNDQPSTQCMKFQTRTLSADGSTLTLAGSVARLLGAIGEGSAVA